MGIALIKDSKVVNIIVADLDFAKEIKDGKGVKYDDAIDVENISCGIGWSYDGTTLTAPVPVVNNNPTTITKYQFLARFTVAERTAIYLSKDTTLAGWIQVFNNCNDIELLHADTIKAVELLDTLNLITTPRKLIILTP